MTTNFYSTTGFTTREVMRLVSNGNLMVGTSSSPSSVELYKEWQEILEMAETNPAIKSALDKLRTTYYLSKDNGNSKT
jgi:hypothetical protein